MKRSTTLVLLPAILLCAMRGPSHAAELSVIERCNSTYENKGQCLVIQGEIDRDSVARAIAQADRLGIKGFLLESGGGDVEAAMELGRYLRKKEAGAELQWRSNDNPGTCASACLFVLAGAVRRSYQIDESEFSSRLGVHRVFSVRTSSSLSQSEREFKKHNDLIKSYLKEMNIPESLLDRMNSVSPVDVRWMSQSDAELYFPSSDPVWLDKRYSSWAKELGISKPDLIIRLQRASQECNKFQSAAKQSPRDAKYLNQLSIEDNLCRKEILNGKR